MPGKCNMGGNTLTRSLMCPAPKQLATGLVTVIRALGRLTGIKQNDREQQTAKEAASVIWVETRYQRRAEEGARQQIADCKNSADANDYPLADLEREARGNEISVQDQINANSSSIGNAEAERRYRSIEAMRVEVVRKAADLAKQTAGEQATLAYQRTYVHAYNDTFEAEFKRLRTKEEERTNLEIPFRRQP